VDIVKISQGRQFSLKNVSKQSLLQGDLEVTLICFEAGQRDEQSQEAHDSVYQVLEGEVLVRVGGETERLGKGKLLRMPAGTAHVLENAGGGLLVVMATTRAQG
jgi:quercetin dioxygenase-like cupin family protein